MEIGRIGLTLSRQGQQMVCRVHVVGAKIAIVAEVVDVGSAMVNGVNAIHKPSVIAGRQEQVVPAQIAGRTHPATSAMEGPEERSAQ